MDKWAEVHVLGNTVCTTIDVAMNTLAMNTFMNNIYNCIVGRNYGELLNPFLSIYLFFYTQLAKVALTYLTRQAYTS